jgi:hypothetical protein
VLDLRLLSEELLARKDEILGFEEKESDLLEKYRQKVPLIDTLGLEVNDKLPRYSGSKVLEEGAFIRRFKKHFLNRGEATDWALEVLRERTVAAVDGSQVFASRSYSVPIGLAQAGLIINRHTGIDGFTVTYKMSLITPDDFDAYGGTSAFSETPVSLKRHQLECDRICEFMRSDPGDLVFFDGSLILSFINNFADEKIRMKYVDSIVKVLQVSEETRTPVAAYTDMPLNKDIVTLMKKHFMLPPVTHLSDVHLIREDLGWGDRTRAFISDRDDKGRENKSVLDLYGRYRDSIAFFYIQSSGGLPSKVEVPKWVFEAGMVDSIADIVRAQCIVRPGYPDIIHRAHEYTAINQSEAEQFDRILDRFAADNHIKIYKSAKELNKQLVHKP